MVGTVGCRSDDEGECALPYRFPIVMPLLLVFGVDQDTDRHHRGAAGLCLILTFVLSFWVHFSAT